MQKARDILDKIFAGHPKNFNNRLWNCHLIEWSRQPKFILGFNDKRTFKRVLLRGDAFTAGKAFIESKVDIDGDIFEAIKLGDYLAALKLRRREKLKLFAQLMIL